MVQEIPTVVFDTNIFVQYFLSPNGMAGSCLEAAESRRARIVVSTDVLAELRDVLLRPNILSRIPGSSTEQIETYLEYISDLSTLIDRVPRRFEFTRDPNDEMILDLAIFAEAEYVVTRDHDLLDLMTGYGHEEKEFRRRFRHTRIIKPKDFLSVIFGVE